MYRERREGLIYSVVFHLLLLLLMLFGLPSFLKNEPPIEPTAITVELLPITGITNVKPTEAQPAEEPKPQPKAEEKPPTPPQPPKPEPKKPSPPVKTAQAAPPPPPKPEPTPEPKKEEKKPEVIKPEEKKPEKKPEPKQEAPKEPKKDDEKDKKKTKEDDLDAILKAVKDTAQKEKQTPKAEPTKPTKDKETGSPSKSVSNNFDPNQMMSLSEKDAIMSQLARCWNPPAGAKNAHELVIIIDAEFTQDGGYVKADIASESRGRYNSDPFFRSAAESALRAIRQCSPLKNLPPEKYEAWKLMELHFDPRQMLQ